ncbi:MAG: hypothetical protein PHF24_09300 [Syntrophomonas sp.]|nr:hypothetical protein [Syntrophomonas sp.]
MNKETALINYKTAMIIFRKLFDNGTITQDELIIIASIIADKYGLPSLSIYRCSA